MGFPNLTLRGSIYWWRRRITVDGKTISLAFSLRTGVFNHARARAGLLSAEVEKLRMAFGETGTAVAPATLQKIFTDAMRRQLDRIVSDQISSPELTTEHARANKVWGELWRFLGVNGPRAKWSPDEHDRLGKEGWAVEDRNAVALELLALGETKISGRQLDAYCERFGIIPSTTNLDLIQRTIFRAREAACREGTKQLEQAGGVFEGWIEAALSSNEPFIVEAKPTVSEPAQGSAPVNHESERQRDGDRNDASPEQQPGAAIRPEPARHPEAAVRPKKLFSEAAEECIRAHVDGKAWSPDSVEQVRTAARLFDFACGGGVAVDDLEQRHVEEFLRLCENLPNRWGKTKDELERGLVASLEYAERLRAGGEPERVGFSDKTVDKHVTWIQAVLKFADDEGSEEGHRPARLLRFNTQKRKIRARGERKGKRPREDRANWSRTEIARLLDAPIWWGCHSLERRFQAGDEIYHDAWYWLPLMYILYGGRSSELAALQLAEVFEGDAIPYFKVEYNDLRDLKNGQSVRSLPIHPELIRLGFLDYVNAMRVSGQKMLFPEMHSPKSKSFAATFYRSVFRKWRAWAFPDGTSWQHRARGAIKDKDVHSFRGVASSMMKGKVADSVRFDILGHEGENTTTRVYDEEASLEEKLAGLRHVSPLTSHLPVHPLRLRPADRLKFGAKRGGPPKRPHLRLVTND
jgi:hypothetical protein